MNDDIEKSILQGRVIKLYILKEYLTNKKTIVDVCILSERKDEDGYNAYVVIEGERYSESKIKEIESSNDRDTVILDLRKH